MRSDRHVETDPGRFYPCVVYDGPVRDLFPSPLADRIGLVPSLRTGLRDPEPDTTADRSFAVIELRPISRAIRKTGSTRRWPKGSVGFRFRPATSNCIPLVRVGEFYRRPRRRLTSRSRVGFETSRGTKELSNKPFHRAHARRARRLSSGRRRRPLNGTSGRRRGEWSSRQIAHAPWITSVLAAVLFAALLAAEAQEAGTVRQVGSRRPVGQVGPLREGLRE